MALERKIAKGGKDAPVHPHVITNFMQVEYSKSGNPEMELPKMKSETKQNGEASMARYRTPY